MDIDNAPEMNLVDRVFRTRDILLEKGELRIILPEEELKKHQRDPRMHNNDMNIFVNGSRDPPGGGCANEILKGIGESAKKLPSPDPKMMRIKIRYIKWIPKTDGAAAC